MTINLNSEQIARIGDCLQQRQSTPQLKNETIEQFLEKVVEYGILHFEYQRKHNVKNYQEYKAWKQSTK
jgi:hypothetical protein